MKKIPMFLVIILLINTVSQGFVTREATVVSEKIIPFSYISENESLEEKLNVKSLSNVKIKEEYVDNGTISTSINGNYIEMKFDEGEWNNSYKTITKIKTLSLDNVKSSDENNIIIMPDEDVEAIDSVSGDFQSAKVLSDGSIEINLKDSADGVFEYDEENLVKSRFTVTIDDKNLNREILSEEIILPYEVKGDVKAVSGDTSAVQKIYVDNNTIKVLFNNGEPIANETTKKVGYPFYWIDRTEDGKFKKHNPNSIYCTDINKITGLGDYVKGEEFDKESLSASSSEWVDFCGIEKDGQRYIYVFDKSKGIPSSFIGNLVEKGKLSFEGQNFNTEKLSVELSNKGVSYIPEGKLYSMGELVANTEGWGETEPNKSWESTKKFFNAVTGREETYVKHFKFFYGPTDNKAFGGYYTYPYNCTFEYEHYKPVMCYSGEIAYQYKTREKINGYSYNGWVKIEYEEEKTVNDYPPTPPFNVKYDSSNGNISWSSAKDDYTLPENLIYEIQVYNGQWSTIEKRNIPNLQISYLINHPQGDVRIRAIDEVNQVSDWAYASKSTIKLNGNITPYIVKAGDSIDIFADTISLKRIDNVVAKNDEMQMYTELQKIEEKFPDFFELSYDVEIDLPNDGHEVFVITNGKRAKGKNGEVNTRDVSVSEEFDYGGINFEFTPTVKMEQSGSIIFSNFNYTNVPTGVFRYDSNFWFLYFDNILYLKNKVTNQREPFFSINSDAEIVRINGSSFYEPKYSIGFNTFLYDEKGNSKYEYISVHKSKLIKPMGVTWKTDETGKTKFDIYLGDENVYSYVAKWEDIDKYVDKCNEVSMYKRIRKLDRTPTGYVNSSSKLSVEWDEFAVSVASRRDIRELPWVGYRIRNNEYVEEQHVRDFNADPNVRNNYRILISDGYMSKDAIKRYNDILKITNISMTDDEHTIFGDDAMEYTSAFEGNDINIPKDTKPGKYQIKLVATDVEGNTAECKLTIIVQGDVEEKDETEKEDVDNDSLEESFYPRLEEAFLGRFFYKEDKGFLEELKLTEKNSDTKGFICAGETLGVIMVTEDVDFIEIDFEGDESIKTLDKLTETFLIDIPESNGKDVSNVKYQYINFPKKIYPQYVDNSEKQVYKWFYTIPYKTIQNLHSWSSLKDETLEKLDTSKLFDRIESPYNLVITLNGDEKSRIHLPFDVFERWDTILNRDVTKYILNSDIRWEMRIDK